MTGAIRLKPPSISMTQLCKAIFSAFVLFAPLVTLISAATDIINVGQRREVFVDRYLIERLDGAQLSLQRPQPREVVLRFDKPWEGPFAAYLTVLKDGDLNRMYYRGASKGDDGNYDKTTEVVCYAESTDGIEWTKPNLGLFEFRGSKENNIVLAAQGGLPIAQNFMPMLDPRPGTPPEERYKAVGGIHETGLFRLVSADGIHWRPLSDKPLFPGYALDSLNVLIWSPAEQVYALYLRTWSGDTNPGKTSWEGFRTISRATSKDFIHWTDPVPMSFGDAPLEHLYTNATQPYFRAPHMLIAMPFRFFPDKRAVDETRMQQWGVFPTQRQGISDAILMSSRGGNSFDRTFLESFIRPGPDPKAWTARSNMPAVGIVPTGPNEMSIYLTTHYTLPGYHVRRYALRTDGFAAVSAPYAGGEMVTKPHVFAGQSLELNYSTSAAGEIRVEIQDAKGVPVPGFSLDECQPLLGDEIARHVSWTSDGNLQDVAGRVVKLRFVMRDADLFSLRFAE